MHINDMFPSKYVSAWDLKGKDVTVTIARISQAEEFNQETEKKETIWLLWFKGAQKAMRCKPVHAKAIAALYGPNNTTWIGKAITLYPTTVKAFGKVHDVVRVRDHKPTQAAASAAPPESLTQPVTDDGDDSIDIDEHEGYHLDQNLADELATITG